MGDGVPFPITQRNGAQTLLIYQRGQKLMRPHFLCYSRTDQKSQESFLLHLLFMLPQLCSKIFELDNFVQQCIWLRQIRNYSSSKNIKVNLIFLKLWQVDHFLLWGFFKFIATKEPNSGNFTHISPRNNCLENIFA